MLLPPFFHSYQDFFTQLVPILIELLHQCCCSSPLFLILSSFSLSQQSPRENVTRTRILFPIPGLGETLRVNGRACLIRHDAILERSMLQGKRPLLAFGVE